MTYAPTACERFVHLDWEDSMESVFYLMNNLGRFTKLRVDMQPTAQPIAVVTFSSEEEAARAVEGGGCVCRRRWSTKELPEDELPGMARTKLYIGNLSWAASLTTIHSTLGAMATPLAVTLHWGGGYKLYGFVKYEQREDADYLWQKANQEDGLALLDQRVIVHYSVNFRDDPRRRSNIQWVM